MVPERPPKVPLGVLPLSRLLLLLLRSVQDGAQPQARPAAAAICVTCAAGPPVLLRRPSLAALNVRHWLWGVSDPHQSELRPHRREYVKQRTQQQMEPFAVVDAAVWRCVLLQAQMFFCS